MADKTLFSKIIDGEIPAEILYEDDLCFAINDIAPKAPIHILLIPKKPLPRLSDGREEDLALLGHLMLTASTVAKTAGIGDAFRLIINNGEEVGQTVFHLHLHILGNMTMSEISLGF